MRGSRKRKRPQRPFKRAELQCRLACACKVIVASQTAREVHSIANCRPGIRTIPGRACGIAAPDNFGASRASNPSKSVVEQRLTVERRPVRLGVAGEDEEARPRKASRAACWRMIERSMRTSGRGRGRGRARRRRHAAFSNVVALASSAVLVCLVAPATSQGLPFYW